MIKLKRHIITFQPVAAFIRASKRVRPPGFRGFSVYQVVQYFRQHSGKVGFNERAAAISFNIIMAVPAFLMFLFTLVPYLPVAERFKKEFLRSIRDVLRSDRVYAVVQNVVNDITDVLSTRRTGLLSVSIIVALFFASNAMMGIMRTFDRSIYQERKGKFLVKRWTAIRLTSILVLLIIVTGLLLSTQMPAAWKLFRDEFGWEQPIVRTIVHYIRWVVIISLNYFSIASIYRYAPAVRIRWKYFSPGAVIACLLTIILAYLFSIWVNNFGRYNQLYGSLSTILLLMNLIFFNALVLLIGFELNVSITMLQLEKEKQSATAPPHTKAPSYKRFNG